MIWLALTALAADLPDPVAASVALPDGGVAPLVAALVGDTDDPAVRARRIHDWIALNIAYDADTYRARGAVASDVGTTLGRGVAVCAGYAELFEAMGEAAGLEVVTIPGYARGDDYDPFAEVLPDDANHAWNAVKLDGAWRLLDVTWDAGGLVDGAFRRAYSRDWWLVDPAVFAHTHLPDDPEWQLLPEPLSAEAFRAQGELEGRFARDLTLLQPLPAVSEVGDSATVRLGRADGVRVSARLLRSDGTPVAGGAFVDQRGAEVRIRARFPEPGDWLLAVFTWRPGDDRGVEAATLAFRSAAGAVGAMPVEFDGWDPAFELVSPDALAPGENRLALRLPGVSEAAVKIGRRWRMMRREGDLFVATVPASGWEVLVPPPGARARSAPWAVILAAEAP